MTLTNTQKTRYTNPALAKSSVRIGVRFKQSDISTLKNHCVFFVDNISRLSTSKKRVFMMGCIGVSQDTPFSVTVRQSDITHHHLNWRSLVMVNLPLTEKINMAIQSIATPVAIQTLSFNGIAVKFTDDAYLNATAIAKAFGKEPRHYLANERTQEYIQALIETVKSESGFPLSQNDLVIIKKGNSKNFEQGTWLHPKLAIDFARWLNPKFAVWCDMQIEKILKGEVVKYTDQEANYNAQWRLIGLLEYDRVSKELRQLQNKLNDLSQDLYRINRTKGLIYDAISEQRIHATDDYKQRLVEAQAFIEKQHEMKLF